MTSLKKAQNKVIRTIAKTKRTKNAWNKLPPLKILPIEKLYKLEVSKICHKHIYGNLPTTFENDIMPQLSVMVHDASTRHSCDINYHFNTSHQMTLANKSFTADCIRIWNDIPYDIKKQTSSKIFSNDLIAKFLVN